MKNKWGMPSSTHTPWASGFQMLAMTLLGASAVRCGALNLTYCGWAVAKSDKPPILDGWNPISNGMFTTYQLVIGISQPSTVSIWWSVEHSYFWLQSADWWFGTFLSFFQSVGDVIIPTDFHSIIFQKGWNHQPDIIYIYIIYIYIT